MAQETVEIVTEPHTNLRQRTCYGFRNDNAPVLQMTTDISAGVKEIKKAAISAHRS